MGLLETVGFKNSPFRPYLNTGTMYDVHTGIFVPGSHGGMVLNGGLTTTNAFVGRPKMFKSTEMLSLGMRCMANYTRSETAINDTEYAQKKERVIAFVPNANYEDLEHRLTITTPEIMSAEEFFELVKKTADEKLKHSADYLVNSMILDPKTLQPVKMFIPTFIVIDSWSKMMSSFMQATLDTKQIGSSDTNMIYMKDGNIKKMIMLQLPALASRAGIYFLLSAHVGNKYELNPYAATPKDMQHMKSTDKLKEVGADFNFVISNSSEMRKVSLLQNENKDDALYPFEGSSNTELNEVVSVLLSCKNAPSGSTLSTIISQKQGILSDLSNYHYLRNNEYFGLIGNKSTHKPVLTDISVSRTKIREKLQDSEFCRAIQILAELCYIQNNWSMVGTEIDFMMKPEILGEKLLSSDQSIIRDILQSRSCWTYDENNLQPYMSTYDVLAIAQNKYKSKLHSITEIKEN